MANFVLSDAAVAKLRALLRDRPGSVAGGAIQPRHIAADRFPAPYTVRWSASEGESGAWVIWLGDPQEVLFVGGSRVMVEGITAAEDLPDGWFTVDDVQESQTAPDAIYLQVSSGTATLTKTYSADAILIAWLESDATTGAKSVMQFVVGALIYGGSGSPQPFDLEVRTENGQTATWVTRCAIAAPETEISCADYQLADPTANVYLVVTRGSSGGSAYYDLAITQTAPSASATTAVWTLWEYDSNNGVYVDKRPKVLPLYAL